MAASCNLRLSIYCVSTGTHLVNYPNENQIMSSQQGRALNPGEAGAHSQSRPQGQLIWYCPSRWLLAHHDPKANIQTLSSHMCLADLNNDGEGLLALIDFKQQQLPIDTKRQFKSPRECRMRVYRGQNLIYNHFLDDIPSCLIVTDSRTYSSPIDQRATSRINSTTNNLRGQAEQGPQQQPLLTMTIMDDVYFYNRLRPAHKLSLEDEESILDSLVKSEVDAWQMVKQNKVDTETMRELLSGLSQELGSQELTSHSLNYLALHSGEARKQYLTAWKFKRLQNGHGEHIMSMDTICCAAARLRFSSSTTRSGDFGQTRESGSFLNNSRWTRVIDLQRDGLVLGTEDRHLLVYELRSLKSRLECHYRLPSVPDHILVERRSPANFDVRANLKELTYKILVSCRNCRIYSLDQLYLSDGNKSSPCKLKELVALKCNVLEMSWCGADDGCSQDAAGLSNNNHTAPTWPLFVVACLDRRVYCFSSQTGQCKWVVELELPITCLICLPKLKIGPDESSLVGVACKANRIDFYVALNGRIVDSIYFSKGDYPVAAAHGRFGREDNCLCLVSHLGHLLIFILKRTAKFAHGQCLSSATSYASDTLASCGQILQQSMSQSETSQSSASRIASQSLKLDKPASVPSAFLLSKPVSAGGADQMIDSMLQLDHDCDQVAAKNVFEAHVGRPQLQVPTKGRDFVDQILKQSRHSRSAGRVFTNQMVKLRDKIKSTMEQQSDMHPSDRTSGLDNGNSRIILTNVTGLGNIYRVSVSIRLNIERFVGRYGQLFVDDSASAHWQLAILIYPLVSNDGAYARGSCQVKPFRVVLPVENDPDSPCGVKAIFESALDFKLYKLSSASSSGPSQNDLFEVQLQVLAIHRSATKETLLRKPLLITAINVPMS